jgi:hypothetical protein
MLQMIESLVQQALKTHMIYQDNIDILNLDGNFLFSKCNFNLYCRSKI